MNRIEESHPRSAWLLMASSFFERLSYYGFRALLVLYMTGETFQMERSEALEVYSMFMGVFAIGHVLGGIIGDLVLGNRNAGLIGALTVSLGMFALLILLIPTIEGLYSAFFLIVLGGSLYAPNVNALFAKEYLSRKKLIVGGFSGLLFTANVGAFFGAILIGSIGDHFSYQSGFMVAGGMMILSILFLALAKLKKPVMEEATPNWAKSRGALIISIAMLSFIGAATYMLNTFSLTLDHHIPLWQTLNKSGMNIDLIENVLRFGFVGLGFLLWTYFYTSHFHKMALGFAFNALAFLMYLLDGHIALEGLEVIYFSGVLLIAMAEIFLSPLMFSIIGTYANPKYFATLIGLSKALTLLFFPLAAIIDLPLDNYGLYGMAAMVIVFAIFGVVSWWLKGRKDLK